MRELEILSELSQRYGKDPRYVLLGGGNTSWKSADTLYIKPSGVALADIRPEQFLALDRAGVRRLFEATLPEDVWEREAEVKSIMLAAVRPLGSGRPSVEAPLHEAIVYAYVIHLHPALVNGMTCAQNGADTCARLFPDAMWVEYVDPGYTLACTIRDRLAEWKAEHGRQPKVIFLQNHGVFVASDDPEEVVGIYDGIMETLARACREAGVALDLEESPADDAVVQELAPRLRTWLGDGAHRAFVTSASAVFAPAEGPLTPDHIVYARAFPLVAEDGIDGDAVRKFREERGYLPRVIAVRGRAVFGAEETLRKARGVLAVARDGALVQQLSAAFGGPRFMTDDQRSFIENWEVESYRRKVSGGAAESGRVARRAAVVTGGAQGFGYGIARGLVREGAVAAIADINLEGAQKAAADLNAVYGPDCAFAVQVDVSDEASVEQMVREVVRVCGGIDLFVANAGVLRAAPTCELSKEAWDFVTAVNYTGYFLCVKHAARVMIAQHEAGPGPWMDVIQINSKSGLEGSSRNAAYAGSKFGGIGLTQSFAKELVDYCIKVNSVCPGNYFDGPLWSDPKNGLFIQYLRAGKVPGAKTVEDVRRFYEEKVPMRRGCTPEDVLRAIFYIVEQEYETGQALPVTGGQIMLR